MAICVSSLKKSSFTFVTHFKTGLLCGNFITGLVYWFTGVLYGFWMWTPSKIHGLNYFPPFCCLSSDSLHCCFLCWAEAFKLDVIPFVWFSFIAHAFGVITQRSWPNPMSWGFSPKFASRTFIAASLIFKYLIHFLLSLVYGMM